MSKKLFLCTIAFLLIGVATAERAWAGEGPDEIKFKLDGVTYKVTLGNDIESGIVTFSNVSVAGIDKSIQSISIPSKVSDSDGISYTVVSIEAKAFINCINLVYVVIPKSVMKIGDNAFKGCSDLLIFCEAKSKPKNWSDLWNPDNRSVVWDYNEQESIQGDSLYYNFSNNTNPPIAEVGYHSFHSKYTSVIIPPKIILPEMGNNIVYEVIGIGANAFSGCGNLKSVNIPSSIQYIGESAFMESGLESVTIPNTVTSIGNLAFYDCGNLKTVTIPESVENIGYGAFADCCSLTEINVENGNTKYLSENGILFDKSKATLICYPAGKSGEYNIPNSVTTILFGAFSECSKLTSLTIPNSVTEVGDGAFSGCVGLTTLTIPNSVESIDEFAFDSCINMKSVFIPLSVKFIGDSVFTGCDNLTIYCEAESEPNNWKLIDWNPDNRPVVWGYNSTEYDNNNGNQNNENQGNETNNGENNNNQNSGNQSNNSGHKPIVPVTDPVSAIINQINTVFNMIYDLTTDVEEEAVKEVNIYAYGNTIVIENADAEIFVYDAMGRLICRNDEKLVRTELHINGTGVYIVKVGNVAKRVMIN